MDSHQHEDRYKELAEKWINGTITVNERIEFSAWYNAGQDDMIVLPSSFAGSEEAFWLMGAQTLRACCHACRA